MTTPWPPEFSDTSVTALSRRGGGIIGIPQVRYGEFHSLDVIGKDGRVLQTSGTYDLSEELKISLNVPPNLAKGASLVYTVMITEPTQMPAIGTFYEDLYPKVKKYPSGPKIFSSRDPTVTRRKGNLTTRLHTELKRSAGGGFGGSSAGSQRPSAELTTTRMSSTAWNSSGGSSTRPQIDVEDYERHWTGSRTPGYRKILRDGGRLPINAHTVSMWRASIGYCAKRADDPGTVSGSPFRSAELAPMSTFFGFPSGPVHLEQALRVATSKLVKFSGNEIEGNLAQDLAQFGQTASLISGTLNRITGSVKALKRGNISAAVTALWQNGNPRFRKGGGPSHTKDLANNWLELQYGWKPLLKDIEGTINSLKKFHNSSSNSILHAASNATAQDSTDITFSSGLSPKGGRVQTSTITKVHKAMNYRVSSRTLAFLAQTGFTNPINLLWEVLPWSFVVDWVLPVGPYLESLSAFHGMEFLDGYSVAFTRQITSVSVSDGGPFPGFPSATSDINGSMNREWIILSREKLLDFPDQAPPSFRNPLSGMHAANALALLVQVFKR